MPDHRMQRGHDRNIILYSDKSGRVAKRVWDRRRKVCEVAAADCSSGPEGPGGLLQEKFESLTRRGRRRFANQPTIRLNGVALTVLKVLSG